MAEETKKDKRQKLGEILIHHGVINQAQLNEAMKVQSQSGDRLGSVLIDLKYSNLDEILEFLGKQTGFPTANLYKTVIDPATLSVLPFKKMKEHLVLPLSINERQLVLGMANPSDFNAINDIEFLIGRPIYPVLILGSQVDAALKIIEGKGGTINTPLRGQDLRVLKIQERVQIAATKLKDIFRMLVNEEASDLLFSAGIPPCIKKDNQVKRLRLPLLTPQDTKAYAYELMKPEQREAFERSKELDLALTFPDIGRFRINIYMQRGSISIAARHIVEVIKKMEDLGIPPWVEEFSLKRQGLILVTGPAGHGKSTTVASMVDTINTKRSCNIVTIEDPIEFFHKHKASNVNQREIGADTASFDEGLRRIFRQSPDVIVIGEMRDPESFEIALRASESGHLVLSTLHSQTATATIERMVDIFPESKQQLIRVLLAEHFLLILNQRLVPLKTGTGRVLACEKLANSYRVRNLIRDNKVHQIRTMFQQSTDDFISIDHSLSKLYHDGKISKETGLMFCDNQVYFNELTGKGATR